ncbi:MAG: hypothetical protein WC455_11830 [Dehalococcoidia bacterium]|jgi:hypothetical protein
MQGIEERLTETGIRVVRVHYTADEAKRSEEWKATAKSGYTNDRDWEREMEINWSIASGLPIFADEFVREWHVAKQILRPIPGKVIVRGWDFGNTPACVWAQLDPNGRILVLNELATWDGRTDERRCFIETFAPAVIRMTNQEYPGFECIDFADPAGWSASQTDGKSCVQLMQKEGIQPRKGTITWTERRSAIIYALTTASGGSPCLVISPNCHMLIEGFQGAYRFQQIGETERFRNDPEKNAWSHPMDALEYVVGALFTPKKHQRNRDEDDYRRKVRKKDKVTGY